MEMYRLLHERAGMLAEISDLRKTRDSLKSALEKALADGDVMRQHCDTIEQQHSQSMLEAEAKVAEQEIVISDLTQKLALATRDRAIAKRSTTTPALGLSSTDLEVAMSPLVGKLEDIHQNICGLANELAKPPVGKQVLVLWDIENVGLPPALSAANVGEIVDKLITKVEQLINPLNLLTYDIVAAYNPRSREMDDFFIPSHVATSLGGRRVRLLDAGGKHGAADLILGSELSKWLAATVALKSDRAVIFITGDGDFTKFLDNAEDAGCATALMYCEHNKSDALYRRFKSANRLCWSEVIGDAGIEALEQRQAKRMARRREMQEQEAAYGEHVAGVNSRPDLEKTKLCDGLEPAVEGEGRSARLVFLPSAGAAQPGPAQLPASSGSGASVAAGSGGAVGKSKAGGRSLAPSLISKGNSPEGAADADDLDTDDLETVCCAIAAAMEDGGGFDRRWLTFDADGDGESVDGRCLTSDSDGDSDSSAVMQLRFLAKGIKVAAQPDRSNAETIQSDAR